MYFSLLLSGPLLLLGGQSLGASLSSLAGVLDVSAGHVEGLVDGALLHVLGDLGALDLGGWSGEGHDLSLGVLLDVASGALLQDDELALVLLQSLDVSLEVLGGLVSSSVVNADADLFGLGGAESGALELLEGEASADSCLGVVSESWALNDGSEGAGDWSWGDGGGLGGSCGSSSDLLGWLVEPSLGELGPGLSLSKVSVS